MRVPPERSPVKVLLFSLVTCGIYYFYWVYVTSRDVDAFLGESDIPPTVHVLLLVFTATLWGFVWDYQIGQKLVRMQQQAGLPVQDNSLLYLVLDLLGAGPIAGLGIIVPLWQQTDLNRVYQAARRRTF